MISRETIEKILDTARIEEVVGDFVSLKRRGVNLIGLCPFHGENTPSFNVNPTRNIYKCFGCGEGGNAVNFLMKHEQLSYPDALRRLAKKYDIEVEETKPDPKEQEQIDERESLYSLNAFALQTFVSQLHEDEEGISIGLTYLRERQFSDEIIRKFQIGYAPEAWDSFAKKAVKAGYQEEYLEKTGLCFRNDRGRLTDRFRGRIIFPIINSSGRVIGFGGRIMKKDDKIAKYLNSPESIIYSKSKNHLYGINLAKSSIVKQDFCYIVEGYVDVTSMHQAGFENVISPGGTSLTADQVKLLSRYTKNITLLMDGDNAGIKAAIKATDLVLQAGLTVKIIVMPEKMDPDDFTRKNTKEAVQEFLRTQSVDIVVFKTRMLTDEAQNDPIQKAKVIHEVVRTIALVQDPILQSTYLKRCSSLMDISESLLINELNKHKRQNLKKEGPIEDAEEIIPQLLDVEKPAETSGTEEQEKNIIRLLLNYGHMSVHPQVEIPSETNPDEYVTVTRETNVARFIVEEISMDEIRFEKPVYDKILSLYASLPESQPYPDPRTLLNHEDDSMRSVVIDLLTSKYELSSNWDTMHGIRVPKEEDLLLHSLQQSILHLKQKKVMRMLEDNRARLKEAESSNEDIIPLLEQHLHLEKLKARIAKVLGIDVIR